LLNNPLLIYSYTVEYFSPDLQTGWIVAAHRVIDTQVTVSAAKCFSLKSVFNLLTLTDL